jgi:nucleoside-diphosphate-sugar epimerase
MKIAVTGATGFLGRHVVAKLRARGCEVTALSRADGNLADPEGATRALSPWRWDAVVNLAAPVTGGTEDLATGMAAARAHARIALAIRRHARGRIVHTSSMTVYGLPRAVPVREDHPRVPMHLYGLGKLLAEDVLDDVAIVLRFGGLFSEERRAGALFHFCRAANEGAPLRVTAPTPTPWEILHVDDAAEGIARATMQDDLLPGAMNLGYGESIELVEMARRIATRAGKGSAVQATTEHPAFQLDVTRARTLLGWNPRSLGERLAALYSAFAS